MALEAWLTLLHAAQSHRGDWHKAFLLHGSPDSLVRESPRALAALGLVDDEIARLKSPDAAVLRRWQNWLDGAHRALVTLGSGDYPPLLAALDEAAPLAIWIEGENRALLTAPQLAIVGSRSPTTGGTETARQFAKYLGERGVTITSGLATGIDGASHRGALDTVGGTVAVLGAGLDSIFPREHERLARDIAARGVLVSEYAPGVGPQKFHFPQRNRIIAGLSVGTLVVEATRRSGSLITARAANDFGREVFAIPGSIHNPLARGCHKLIRDGAKLVEEASDILIELAPKLAIDVAAAVAAAPRSEPSDDVRSNDPCYRKLLDALEFAPQPIGVLATRTGLTTAELSSMLLVLELEGFVEALPGGRYSRLAKRE